MPKDKNELNKARKTLLDKVMGYFNGGEIEWAKGWHTNIPPAPVSVASGKRYKGINNAILFFTAIERGYMDNRWATFNQIEKNGWSFKKDESGKSLGKNAGVPIELYKIYDKSTKKDLDFKEFNKLTLEEQREYWKENVQVFTRTYIVFNADIIDGIEPLERKKFTHITPSEIHDRAEKIIRAWNDKQCPITHDGGYRAYYSPSDDSIHLPEKTSFVSLEDYYGTTLHEIGHSTGHKSRLNRDLSGGFGSEKYAIEELRAEFTSLFMQQETAISMSEFHIKNHAAYLQSWAEVIEKDSKILFDAVSDAEKASTYILDNAASMEAQAVQEAVTEQEQDNDKARLTARLAICKSALKVLNTDMSSLVGMYVDGLSDMVFEIKEELTAKLKGSEIAEERTKPYIQEALNEYKRLLWADGYPEKHGWTKNNIETALVRNIENEKIKSYAQEVLESEGAEASEQAPSAALLQMLEDMPQPAAPFQNDAADNARQFVND